MNKVTIIGAGAVGATIAYTMTVKGQASEIVLIDINADKALGEALDIRQGVPLLQEPVAVYAGSYADAEGSDVVIITSGIARKPGQTRIDLTRTNVEIIKSIAPEITKYAPDATYIIVSNPVDVLTYVFNKITDIPEANIIGSGTLLDTARLRARLAEYLTVSQKNVHAYVLGEHGDTSFIPWSIAQVSTIDLTDYQELIKFNNGACIAFDHEDIENYMRASGGKIIARKGATYYAIAISVCGICDCLFSNANAVATVSTMMNGEYGIEDVCLSIPTMIGKGKVQGKILPKLTEEEIGKLRRSAEALKSVIAQIEI